jgi:peptidoglycan/xylan/chitin deacetylase (PgdA/CDA1 family)
VAVALERHPGRRRRSSRPGHEVVSHGWKWIEYQYVSEGEVEARCIRRAVSEA